MINQNEGARPHDDKVADHGHKYAEDFADVVKDAIGRHGTTSSLSRVDD